MMKIEEYNVLENIVEDQVTSGLCLCHGLGKIKKVGNTV